MCLRWRAEEVGNNIWSIKWCIAKKIRPFLEVGNASWSSQKEQVCWEDDGSVFSLFLSTSSDVDQLDGLWPPSWTKM